MFKPLLAPGESPATYPDYFKKLRYPLLASPKYDGIRCVVRNGLCLSRTGKALPSYQVQQTFKGYNFLDGELIEGEPTDFDVYNRTQSYVMSHDKIGDIMFYVFDYTQPEFLNQPFYKRLEGLHKLCKGYNSPNIIMVPHTDIETFEELLEYEERCLKDGFEGIMLRDPVAYYKQGRGTFKEGIIYKLKRFEDAEGVVVDFEEQMQNNNPLETDELGYAKRSTKKEGMIFANTLGKFIIEYNGSELAIAPGNFNHEQRKYIWENRDRFIYKQLKFRFFNHGIKDKPRFPRAIGFRDEIDL